MHVEVVEADAGYIAIYLDGELDTWGEGDPLVLLEAALEDRVVTRFRVRSLGGYGMGAVKYEDLPDRIEDIPPRWWEDGLYDLDVDDEDVAG